jgi:hypothetical protein
MSVLELVQRHGRKAAVAMAVAATLSLGATSQPAQARGGAGIALGVVGGAVAGAAIASTVANPYYNPYYPYGYYGPPPAAYYPPAPVYQPRSCWDPYYRRYYQC